MLDFCELYHATEMFWYTILIIFCIFSTEQHRKNLKKYHFELSKIKSTDQSNSKLDAEFRHIWQRLEDLEKEEEKQFELRLLF